MADSNPPKRIFLWTIPRSLSNVFEKSVAHMDGALVWHEPYSVVYFNRIFQNPLTYDRFPRMKTFQAQVQRAVDSIDSVKDQYKGGSLQHERQTPFTFEYVKEQLERPLPEGKKFMFIKDMAFGIDGHYDKLPEGPFKHTFLIRNPNRNALSFRRLLAKFYEYEGDLEEFDIGAGVHPFMSWDLLSKNPLYKLWNYVREDLDPNPVVIDADDLHNHTGDVLRKYCEAVGIPWEDRYLSLPENDDYIKYTYGSLDRMVWVRRSGHCHGSHHSKNIRPCTEGVPDVPTGCREYVAEFEEGYQVMYEHRIKPDQ